MAALEPLFDDNKTIIESNGNRLVLPDNARIVMFLSGIHSDDNDEPINWSRRTF